MNNTLSKQANSYVDLVNEIARNAGIEIMRFYKTGFNVQSKSPNNPVTEADFASNDIIHAGLRDINADIPIISEENQLPDYAVRSRWSLFWLIDPLDGTRSFVNGGNQFTVNIALIADHSPILGTVYVPFEDQMYWGVIGEGAYCQRESPSQPQPIRVREFCGENATIIAPENRTREQVQSLSESLRKASIEVSILNSSSSVKFCRVAEGAADIYPNFNSIHEWDSAAAQCVVECAGGSVQDFNGNTIRYNNDNPKMLNPPFVVVGSGQFDWFKYLPES